MNIRIVYVIPQGILLLMGSKQTGLGGFEPPTFGLEARRSILAKPQAQKRIYIFVLFIFIPLV